MSIPRNPARRIAAFAVLALALAGCASQKATGGAADPSAVGGDGVKTGPGVTADKISIGLMTDLTGPYASFGKSLTQAQQLYFEQTNAAGGVCGRQLEAVVRDHGYDAQKAVAAYTEIGPKVVALAHVVGSPMVNAIKQRIETDQMLTIPQAWATGLLGSKPIQVTATTYDIDMINGVDFLAKEKGIKSGDKIGHLYFEGDYGESALNGSKYAAEKLGLKIVEQKIKATDQDMSAQVAAFKAEGVKAVLVSVGPKQTASLVGVSLAKGMDVPFVGSNSAYSPQLLPTPAGPALLKDFYYMTGGAPISSDRPAMKKLAADYAAKYPDTPIDSGVSSGYAAAAIVVDALKKACEGKDLTRAGVVGAHRSQSAWGEQFGTTMDFTRFDKPASLLSYVAKPDKAALGGAVIFKEAAASDLAKEYQVPVG
ncbi:ABC-type branched-subunit amino acid transport system substrate-binding protein [Streptosporangium becharense]|uniref:ABC-type branched-subunit amino acid transport system substrate-binding protein n=1 Tax=Streptosporangium becharense TaxID=1816182 RepID=A0A7W9MF67_9ACTN|nr:ABC transporter substrate-binding protein [Streptosporangium becharense]MBB2912974.1 ABC-type branched-subunit amino acid transport system substrate-binding protein [Streptosporangium becharense]MBB5818201.1 ABC-type branched-subunit amino acid transport system substrate-binding protein [Streptosporangium becharense]